MWRLLRIVSIVVVLGIELVVSASADRLLFPATFALPAGFQPEGIAIGALPIAYFGSRVDGTLYRADLLTGQGSVLIPGPGTPALGLAVDRYGRLFVAGGTGGDARVVDTGTGAILASYRFDSADSFINDVVLTPTGAWFTDSYTPVLHHLPFGPDGALPSSTQITQLRLSGDIEYVAGAINANGIVPTADGSGLIVVGSATGVLYHVDPATGRTDRIDLGTESVAHGDGLLWHAGRLLVVQNRLDVIAEVVLDAEGRRGTVQRRRGDARFDVPTTIAAFAGRLYLPNARFTTPPGPHTVYDVVAVTP